MHPKRFRWFGGVLILFLASAAAADEPGVPAAPVAASANDPSDALRVMQQQIDELKAWKEAREQEDLRQAASSAARQEGPAAEAPPRVFLGGERALQALNPEISVTGDFFARFVHEEGKEYAGDERTGFFFRGLGLHFQANLDPFSFFKAAVGASPEGVELEEAYITWIAPLPRMNLTAGRFRQQLGAVNRWHKHALDQFDFPLMLLEPFGPEGLNQTGISLDVLLPPLWASEETVTLQVTNGQNGRVFSGGFFSIPTFLLRLRSYWDVSRDTYLDLGLTGVVGFNHARGATTDEGTAATDVFDAAGKPVALYDAAGNPVQLVTATSGAGPVDESRRLTAFGGADLTLAWEPANRSHYAGVTWRTEFLYGYKEMPTGDPISWMGGYTSLDVKVHQAWSVNLAADLAEPFSANNGGHYLWRAAPGLNYRPSEFVRLHLEYNALDGDLRPLEHRAILQVVFAAGPHKHERY